jgi:lipopolysaccharide cholinephosphotransferase
MEEKEYQKIDLPTLHSVQLEMLKVLAKLCDEHKIRYYLASGTLLGAARHKNFIPWDDDLDIQIPRPDFNTLIKILKNIELPYPMSYSWLDNKSHIYPFLKIYYDNSLVKESKLEFPYNHSKIWIDVFPIDGLPSNRVSLHLKYFISKQLRNLLYTSIVDPKCLNGIQKSGTIFLKPFTKVVTPHFIAKLLDRYSRKKNFHLYRVIGNLTWGEHIGEAMDKDKYLPVVDLKFGKETFHCPRGFVEHLENLYGDYNVLPDVTKRKGHLDEMFLIK